MGTSDEMLQSMNHFTDFQKAFQNVVDSSRSEREQQTIDLENFRDKLMEDLL